MQSNNGNDSIHPRVFLDLLVTLLVLILFGYAFSSVISAPKLSYNDSTGMVLANKNPGFTTIVGSFNTFHDVKCKNGYVVGQTGAMRYMINRYGSKISDGFHRFREVDGSFYARVGAEGRKLSLQGEPVSCESRAFKMQVH